MARVWKPSIEEYNACNKQARREGIYAGITTGLFGAVFGQRALKFDRKMSLFAGLLTGALSGYYFSQAFLSSHLARLRQNSIEIAIASQRPSETDGTVLSNNTPDSASSSGRVV